MTVGPTDKHGLRSDLAQVSEQKFHFCNNREEHHFSPTLFDTQVIEMYKM